MNLTEHTKNFDKPGLSEGDVLLTDIPRELCEELMAINDEHMEMHFEFIRLMTKQKKLWFKIYDLISKTDIRAFVDQAELTIQSNYRELIFLGWKEDDDDDGIPPFLPTELKNAIKAQIKNFQKERI